MHGSAGGRLAPICDRLQRSPLRPGVAAARYRYSISRRFTRADAAARHGCWDDNFPALRLGAGATHARRRGRRWSGWTARCHGGPPAPDRCDVGPRPWRRPAPAFMGWNAHRCGRRRRNTLTRRNRRPANEARRPHPAVDQSPRDWQTQDRQPPGNLVASADAGTPDQIPDRVDSQDVLRQPEPGDQHRQNYRLQRHVLVTIMLPSRLFSETRAISPVVPETRNTQERARHPSTV